MIAEQASRLISDVKKLFGLVAVVLLVACGSAGVKCSKVFIFLEGNVGGEGATGGQIFVEVIPPANTASSPIAIDGGQFKSRIAFDTTYSGSWSRHNCSRRPTVVKILLVSEGEEVHRLELDVDSSFKRSEDGDYSLSKPLKLLESSTSKQDDG